MRVLVVNAGSSTLKLALIDGDDQTLASREIAAARAVVDRAEVRAALVGELGQADAVGHRIVHGGARFDAPIRVDDQVESALRELTDLAPLHQPKSLAALDAVSAELPALPAVACFDTAFHATMGPAATTYALPESWRAQWPIRRFGFHGLSHAWIAQRVPELLGRDGGELRIVSCHLGAGASLCAIANGRSRDTTMGFTPLEGLVMATRSGSVDPGLLLWLLEHGALSPATLADALEHESGLLGLAGTADMRAVVERANKADSTARLARRWQRHSAASMCSRLPVASVNDPRSCGRLRSMDLAFSVWRSSLRTMRPPSPTPIFRRRTRRPGLSWSPRARTSRSRDRRAACSVPEHRGSDS